MRSIILITSLLLSTGVAFADDWSIDQVHSNIGFSVTHMMVSTVHGSFTSYNGKISFDPKAPENFVGELSIDVKSITTGVEKRDNHLRSGDFFAADSFPNITYKAKKLVSLGDDKYRVIGDITIRGVTKELVLEGEGFAKFAKNPMGKTVTAASVHGTLNRQDFGVKWNYKLDAGGVVVSDDVNIQIDLELVKKEG